LKSFKQDMVWPARIFYMFGTAGKEKKYAAFDRGLVKFKHYNENPTGKIGADRRCQLWFWLRLNISSTEFGLEDEVIMPGWARERGLRLYFQTARWRIFCRLCTKVLALRFCRPWLAALPAIASDLPVFAWSCGWRGLIFQSARQGRCGDSDGLRIATDEKLRAELTAKGLIRAKEFSWEKCARETLDCLIAAGHWHYFFNVVKIT